MLQVFAPYWEWEDFNNGMYEDICAKSLPLLLEQAVEILSSPELFDALLSEMLKSWKVSSAVNLSNRGMNRRAWLGRAACCFALRIPEDVTRQAWKQLTDRQRNEANLIATKHIIKYEQENSGIYQGAERKRVFN